MEGINKYRWSIVAGMAGTAVVSVARTFQWPNDWAEIHWLIGYRFGFIKRGLPGAVLSLISGQHPTGETIEIAIRIASTGILCLLIFSILRSCRTILIQSGDAFRATLIVLLFLTSPYMVMLGHLNGYFDHIVVLLSFLAVKLLAGGRIRWSAVCLGIGVLVHESILVIGLPVVLWLAFTRFRYRFPDVASDHFLREFFKTYGYLILIPLIVFSVLLIHPLFFINPQTVIHQIQAELSRYTFLDDSAALKINWAFATGFFRYLRELSPFALIYLLDPGYLFRIVPPVLLFLFINRTFLPRAPGKRSTLAYYLIPFTPVLLLVTAWDISRIWSYAFITSFLMVWGLFLLQSADRSHPKMKRTTINAAEITVFAFILLQILYPYPLLDSQQEHFSALIRLMMYVPFTAAVIYPAVSGHRDVQRNN